MVGAIPWTAMLDGQNTKVAKPPQTYHHYFIKMKQLPDNIETTEGVPCFGGGARTTSQQHVTQRGGGAHGMSTAMTVSVIHFRPRSLPVSF